MTLNCCIVLAGVDTVLNKARLDSDQIPGRRSDEPRFLRAICAVHRVACCEDAMGRAAKAGHLRRSEATDGAPHVATFYASRSLASLEQDSTIIAVIEMSESKWLVAVVVPGVERQPSTKRLDADKAALLKVLHRWRNEAGQAGRQVKRIVVAYEAARWLLAGALAAGVRVLKLRHRCCEHRGIARTSTRKD